MRLASYDDVDFAKISGKPEINRSIADFINLDTDELLESSIVHGPTSVRLAKMEVQALRYAKRLSASIMARDDYGLKLVVRLSTSDPTSDEQ